MLQLSRVIASCDMGGGGCDAGMPSFQVWVDAIGEKDRDTIMQRLDANLYQFIMNLLDKFYSNRRSLCKIFSRSLPIPVSFRTNGNRSFMLERFISCTSCCTMPWHSAACCILDVPMCRVTSRRAEGASLASKLETHVWNKVWNLKHIPG